MAEETTPDLQEWRELYSAAARIKELAPWEWMTEADIFCVQSPETGELGWLAGRTRPQARRHERC